MLKPKDNKKGDHKSAVSLFVSCFNHDTKFCEDLLPWSDKLPVMERLRFMLKMTGKGGSDL